GLFRPRRGYTVIIQSQRFRYPLVRALTLSAVALTVAVTPAVAAALTFFRIDVPTAQDSHPRGINDRGQIVGAFSNGGVSPFHGFLLDGGRFALIEVPGAKAAAPQGINRGGQIVGASTDAGDVTHGFFLDKGRFSPIDVPGATGTAASGINQGGQIVGAFTDASGGTHGFLLVNGVFTPI